jgi:hypothetical protein
MCIMKTNQKTRLLARILVGRTFGPVMDSSGATRPPLAPDKPAAPGFANPEIFVAGQTALSIIPVSPIIGSLEKGI